MEDIKEELLGGKAVWEDSAEKREASLRERKAQMVLAARQYVFFFLFFSFAFFLVACRLHPVFLNPYLQF